MNAVIMDELVIEEECIIGALTFIKAGEHIPRRSLVAGNPGKILKQVSDDMLQWKSEGTKIYQALPAACFSGLRPVFPKTRVDETQGSAGQEIPVYQPWKSSGKS